MDISIEARVSRALISVNRAVCGGAYSHQYHMQGTYKIADRPGSGPPSVLCPGLRQVSSGSGP
jgi:hypothetical protein